MPALRRPSTPKIETLGYQDPILLKRVSKVRCKSANGKSWKGVRGCQSIT